MNNNNITLDDCIHFSRKDVDNVYTMLQCNFNLTVKSLRTFDELESLRFPEEMLKDLRERMQRQITATLLHALTNQLQTKDSTLWQYHLPDLMSLKTTLFNSFERQFPEGQPSSMPFGTSW
jgi:hypothetical protein